LVNKIFSPSYCCRKSNFIKKKNIKKIIIFASGTGTNAENIINYYKVNTEVEIIMVFTNNPNAGVIDRISSMKIPTKIFDKVELNNGTLKQQIEILNPDLIVLAGFLLKIPLDIIRTFNGKIINIHPALLPKHGGKGMYGDRVHQSVKEARDLQTGITIHNVNENYDQGSIIFQTKVEIKSQDSIKDIAIKVKKLEYEHYPKVINKILFP
tara:strand:+ start:73 stop:702 length:630 start_codon:yes stop_codon:yes gene_type:complete